MFVKQEGVQRGLSGEKEMLCISLNTILIRYSTCLVSLPYGFIYLLHSGNDEANQADPMARSQS